MWWFPWLVVWCVFLHVSAIILPILYPDASAEELQIAKIMKGVSFFGILISAIFAALFVVQRRATLERNQEARFRFPTRATWNEVVRNANKGKTVRLANLSNQQDIVALEEFKAGQRIALLPTSMATIKTPFHLSTVERMRNQNQFTHPTTRRRLLNKNIEVVKITR